jgi:opacity protein-like surface antigen
MKRTLLILSLAAALAPSTAAADIIGVYVAGKGDYVHGTGDVFTNFQADMGYGVEAGIEILGLEIWGEALFMGADQYLMTANLGFGIELGGDIRITAGAYTGPMFFKFAPQEAEGLQIPDDVRNILDTAGVSATELESDYNKEFAAQEKSITGGAVGWNVLRGRLLIEKSLLPFLTIGIGGHVGYHFILSGEAAVAGARDEAIDALYAKLDKQYMLSEFQGGKAIPAKLKEAAGAEPIDEDNLDGLNYNVGAFLKLKL